ncbi:hypothetical protein C8Q76DRAFT_414866 [Earliella scabrosa]|nr:hypothetical protein C8Q76DRAFT_414866 [Earliella scabrosa]
MGDLKLNPCAPSRDLRNPERVTRIQLRAMLTPETSLEITACGTHRGRAVTITTGVHNSRTGNGLSAPRRCAWAGRPRESPWLVKWVGLGGCSINTPALCELRRTHPTLLHAKPGTSEGSNAIYVANAAAIAGCTSQVTVPPGRAHRDCRVQPGQTVSPPHRAIGRSRRGLEDDSWNVPFFLQVFLRGTYEQDERDALMAELLGPPQVEPSDHSPRRGEARQGGANGVKPEGSGCDTSFRITPLEVYAVWQTHPVDACQI